MSLKCDRVYKKKKKKTSIKRESTYSLSLYYMSIPLETFLWNRLVWS